MSRVTYKRRGFFLAETAAACFIAGIFLAAIFSALYVSGVLFSRQIEALKGARLKREALAESTTSETQADVI